MINTGNDTRTAGLAISKDLYLELKLDMIPVKPRRVNTAAIGAYIAMLGYIHMFIESPVYYVFEQVVVRNGEYVFNPRRACCD